MRAEWEAAVHDFDAMRRRYEESTEPSAFESVEPHYEQALRPPAGDVQATGKDCLQGAFLTNIDAAMKLLSAAVIENFAAIDWLLNEAAVFVVSGKPIDIWKDNQVSEEQKDTSLVSTDAERQSGSIASTTGKRPPLPSKANLPPPPPPSPSAPRHVA
jgi:hypothetical protein